MKVYESCGTLNVNASTGEMTVAPKTMLPILKFGGNYRIVEHYNISSKNYYGILAILVMEGEDNRNLREYPTEDFILQTITDPIDLTEFKAYNNGRDFSEITAHDKICYFVFHDTEFGANGDETDRLNDLQNELEINKGEIPEIFYTSSNKGINIPKVGSGGILMLTGCK